MQGKQGARVSLYGHHLILQTGDMNTYIGALRQQALRFVGDSDDGLTALQNCEKPGNLYGFPRPGNDHRNGIAVGFMPVVEKLASLDRNGIDAERTEEVLQRNRGIQ